MSTLRVTNIKPQSGDNLYLTGSLIVSDTVHAREVITTISSSQILVSGSTRFGDSSDDTHLFTGSIEVTNGITGSTEFSTIVNKPTLLSGSTQIASEISGSFGAASASLASRIVNNDFDITSLQTDSGSFSTRVTNLETFSSSLNDTYATDAELAAVSSSLAAETAQLINFSSSLDSTYATDAELAAVSSSLAAETAQLLNFSSSLDNTYATDAEVQTAVSGLNAATSSYALESTAALKTQITGSFNILSASLASRIASNDTDINTLGNTNNTQDTKIGNLTAATSSYALSTEISGSFNVASASLASRIASNDTDIATNVTNIANRQLIVTSSSPAQNSYIIPVQVDCIPAGSTFLTGSFETASILSLNYSGSNGTHTLTLPDATTTTSTYRSIRVISNGTVDNQHQVSLIPSASQTLDGGTGGFTFNRSYEGVMIWSDGTEWFQIQAKNV